MVNCYNYALVVNPEIKPIFLRNKEGTWQLQVSVLMYSWECPEAAFNSKELRLEINIAATKSNATGKHTCHDLIMNLWDANTGIQYAYANVCITIKENKPLIVGEKAGVFNILTKILSNVSLEENIALINTTPLEKVFWAFAYDPLPCEDFMEEVALRDVTEEEAQLLLSDLLNNVSLVMETSAVTTNYQEMVIHKPCVATTSYVGSELTIAGPALVEEQDGGLDGVLAVQYRVSDNYMAEIGDTNSYTTINFTVGNDSWGIGAVKLYNTGRSYNSGLMFYPPGMMMVVPDIEESKKNLMRSNGDYSVTGSDAPDVAASFLPMAVAIDINKKDEELLCLFMRNSRFYVTIPSKD